MSTATNGAATEAASDAIEPAQRKNVIVHEFAANDTKAARDLSSK